MSSKSKSKSTPLSALTKQELIAEAKQRKIYTSERLKTSPSSATKVDLRKALVAERSLQSRRKNEKRLRSEIVRSLGPAATALTGVALGVYIQKLRQAKQQSKKNRNNKHIPTDPGEITQQWFDRKQGDQLMKQALHELDIAKPQRAPPLIANFRSNQTPDAPRSKEAGSGSGSMVIDPEINMQPVDSLSYPSLPPTPIHHEPIYGNAASIAADVKRRLSKEKKALKQSEFDFEGFTPTKSAMDRVQHRR
jgi:hypothetical protein